jgi:hypothetical protein
MNKKSIKLIKLTEPDPLRDKTRKTITATVNEEYKKKTFIA